MCLLFYAHTANIDKIVLDSDINCRDQILFPLLRVFISNIFYKKEIRKSNLTQPSFEVGSRCRCLIDHFQAYSLNSSTFVCVCMPAYVFCVYACVFRFVSVCVCDHLYSNSLNTLNLVSAYRMCLCMLVFVPTKVCERVCVITFAQTFWTL